MPTEARMILVAGGAGYIGSHMVLALSEAGFIPIVLDNLSTGHAKSAYGAKRIIGDIADRALLQQLFRTYRFHAVMHFASYIDVAESMREPAKYYQNNVAATINLLNVMIENKVDKLIFSSSAAVYGEPRYSPIDEKHVLAPINPYGKSKCMVETIIQDYAQSYGLHFAILRYFNAAGADPNGRLGECHTPESHLIPLALQVALGIKETLSIFGNTYPTKDGTCIRDYVHVSDLCAAHLLALHALLSGHAPMLFNVGTGTGYSVQDVINSATRVTAREIATTIQTRRAGDPTVLLADVCLIKNVLGWQPNFVDLDIMVEHAWQFMRNAFVMS